MIDRVETKTFDQLITPDPRTLPFSPLGFLPGTVTSELATELQQEAIGWCDLRENVPEQTRLAFERLRAVHTYGVLCYELFTVAADLSLLVFEQALGERFVALYDGRIPLAAKDGTEDVFVVRGFDEIYGALNRRGSHAKGGWQVRLRSGATMPLTGTLDQLFTWARAEGLLPGQRSRYLHQLLVKMRHSVAHPHGFHVNMPNESQRSIAELSEIVNQLWGNPTPGGRLYGGPIKREVRAVGWDERTSIHAPANILDRVPDGRDLTYLILLVPAAEMNPWWDVHQFDTRFEATSLPCDLLWGPGSLSEAVSWLKDAQPTGDEIQYLDRPYLVRVRADRVDLPRRPRVAAAMGHEPGDLWHLICADYPSDAFVHVRNLAQLGTAADCSTTGECPVCAVTTWATGDLADVLAAAQSRGVDVTPQSPLDVRVPARW